MNANIGCFVVGCDNKVAGQCSGYKGSCGRFYCHTHSVGKFCGECGKLKLSDDKQRAQEEAMERTIRDYIQTAESVKEPTATLAGAIFALIFSGIFFALAIYGIPGLSPAFGFPIIDYPLFNFQNMNYGFPNLCLIGGIICFIAAIKSMTNMRAEWKDFERELIEIEKSKPDFRGFHKWHKEQKIKDAKKAAAKLRNEFLRDMAKATFEGVAEGGKKAANEITKDFRQ